MKKSFKYFHSQLIVFFLILSSRFICQSQISMIEEPGSQTIIDTTFIKMNDFPQVDVIGNKPALLYCIPGSANLITDISLNSTKPMTGN